LIWFSSSVSNQLRLDPRGRDANQRLTGKRDRALGDRIDLAAEPKPLQIAQQRRSETDPLEVGKLLRTEPQLGDDSQRWAQAGDQQPVAPRRQLSHEQFEDRRLGHPVHQIAGRHRKLVLIDQQRRLRRRQQPRIISRRQRIL
jgi:hypothetical protein